MEVESSIKLNLEITFVFDLVVVDAVEFYLASRLLDFFADR